MNPECSIQFDSWPLNLTLFSSMAAYFEDLLDLCPLLSESPVSRRFLQKACDSIETCVLMLLAPVAPAG